MILGRRVGVHRHAVDALESGISSLGCRARVTGALRDDCRCAVVGDALLLGDAGGRRFKTHVGFAHVVFRLVCWAKSLRWLRRFRPVAAIGPYVQEEPPPLLPIIHCLVVERPLLVVEAVSELRLQLVGIVE